MRRLKKIVLMYMYDISNRAQMTLLVAEKKTPRSRLSFGVASWEWIFISLRPIGAQQMFQLSHM